MFKRANKITSLLVAAAAVVSLVPASAADVKKVDSQDGVVYNAVAYKGADLVDGEVKDNDGAYYLKDGKYTELANVDSGSDYTVFGTKYVQIDDGEDYNVDLSTGKVLDSDVASDDEDDAASALRKKAKDSDRYADSITTTGTTVFGDNNIADLGLVHGNKFAETWYSTKIAAQTPAQSGMSDSNAVKYFNVFTDVKGNYIDADYNLGKIKVSTTAAGTESVTIENTKDTYKVVTASSTDDTSAKITDSKVLGQDKDNIYRYAEITVNTIADGNKQVFINGKAFNTTVTGATTVVLHAIQKISKAQDSDDIDDAMYAKTVTNYILTDEDGKTDTDATAFSTLAQLPGTQANVVGGKLVLFNVDNTTNADPNVKIQAATLKSKNGFYYTDAEGDANVKAEFNDKLDKVAVDTDVDGNIYVLEDGYVKKFDGTDDWTKIYKVDGSMNAISSYDKDNMVVWSQEDEVYSVIGGKDETKTETPAVTTPVVKAGWAQAADGTWSFVNAAGTKATGWFQDATGTWYFAKGTTMVANEWAQSGSTWYYLGASGAMATNAWVKSGADWYYVSGSGAMLSNTVVDGYKLGASGAWVK